MRKHPTPIFSLKKLLGGFCLGVGVAIIGLQLYATYWQGNNTGNGLSITGIIASIIGVGTLNRSRLLNR